MAELLDCCCVHSSAFIRYKSQKVDPAGKTHTTADSPPNRPFAGQTVIGYDGLVNLSNELKVGVAGRPWLGPSPSLDLGPPHWPPCPLPPGRRETWSTSRAASAVTPPLTALTSRTLHIKLDGLLDSNPLSLPPQALRRQSSSTSGYSRKGSAASLSSTSGSERDRRSRTAALLLDDDEESGSAAGASGGVTSGSSAGTTSAAVVHAQESPVLLIRSRSNNRQVKSAIENLRQVDDDLFEL
ncbi:hypothetical protein RRG08_061123 [Elysia crispata]|uniref:Uncharacterized protein n=1 Tax=Elysia crispata TaxID=231223 RepID=A0AAE0XDD5_9GAST|nr:hypothetical protein RRG08_061123 [Elysia crispata]